MFGHAHLQSHTDSRALRVEYCTVDIPHNKAIISLLSTCAERII